MTLTLREKLNGYQLFHSFVSPHTDRTLKPFIYRDNVMQPPWLKLVEEIEDFNRYNLKTSPSLKFKRDILHDHNYLGSREIVPESYGVHYSPHSNIVVRVEEQEKEPNSSKITTNITSVDNNSVSETDKLNENKSCRAELRPSGRSHIGEDNIMEDELEEEPSDKDTSHIEESTNEARKIGKGNEGKAERENEGNVFQNKDDKREGKEKIREFFRTKDKLSSGRTIDFCYVREEHIRAINTLVEELFWPNINMKECLLYPEFTVVALCGKLVVGLGAMVPNPSKPNETYITFLCTRQHWRGAGVGSFMLYHLMAACQGCHISLHCSVSRHAALGLYFQLGFKVQCVVLNFYKPYLGSHPRADMSPHAFYLKYTRDSN